MTKVTLIGSALLLFGVASGMGLDRLLTSDGSASQADSAGGGIAPVAHFAATRQSSVTIDADQIHTIVREELSSALQRTQGKASSGPSTQVVTTASPQQQREALDSVNTILSAGQWGTIERGNFHRQLALLTPEEAEQAMQQLVQAIDNGSLKVSIHGPML
jgi:hypothetical protein